MTGTTKVRVSAPAGVSRQGSSATLTPWARVTNDAANSAAEALRALEQSLRECRGCGLCNGRTQVVFGVGNPDAELMFVGEGPGLSRGQAGRAVRRRSREAVDRTARRDRPWACRRLHRQRGQVPTPREPRSHARGDRGLQPTPDGPDRHHQTARHLHSGPFCRQAPRRYRTQHDRHTRQGQGTGDRWSVRLVVFPVFHPAAALYTPANRKVLQADFAKLRHLLANGLDALEARPAETMRESQPSGPGTRLGQALPRAAAAGRPRPGWSNCLFGRGSGGGWPCRGRSWPGRPGCG